MLLLGFGVHLITKVRFMSKWFTSKVDAAYDKKIDATGLSIFRIAYSFVLLLEVIALFRYRHLDFYPVPYLETFELNLVPVFILWMVLICMLVFGVFTRFSAIVNYLLSLLFFGSITTFEYHMFVGVNFLLIFLPVSTNFSVDRILKKLKHSNTRFEYKPPTKVTVLSYHIPLLVAVGFVKRFTAFYIGQNHLDFNNPTISVKVEKVPDVYEWGENFLERQRKSV